MTYTSSFSDRINGLNINISSIQANYQNVMNTSIKGNFASVTTMNEGLEIIKKGFSQWPTVKNSLEDAVQLIINLKKQLDCFDIDAIDETTISQIRNFQNGPLKQSSVVWSAAINSFSYFSNQLIESSKECQPVIIQAQTKLQNDQNKLNDDAHHYKNELDDYNSAGSFAIGVITAGIYTWVKYNEVKDEYDKVINEQKQLNDEYNQYNQALLRFNSSNFSAQNAVHMLAAFQNSIQQVQNLLNDLPNLNSTNLHVLKPLLQAAKSDFN